MGQNPTGGDQRALKPESWGETKFLMSGPLTDKNEELSSSQGFVSLDGFSLCDLVKITTEAFGCMWREASR